MSDRFDPVGTLFTSIEKLVFEPSWKRFFHLALVLALLFLGLAIFEAYTRNFELARLERSVDILRKLHALKSETGDTNEQELVRMESALEIEMKAIIRAQPPLATEVQTGNGIRPSWWLKFLSALAPWLLIVYLMVKSEVKKGRSVLTSFMGGFTVSLFFAGLAAVIPAWHWPWFNLVIYPVLQFGIILVIAIIVAVIAQTQKRKPS